MLWRTPADLTRSAFELAIGDKVRGRLNWSFIMRKFNRMHICVSQGSNRNIAWLIQTNWEKTVDENPRIQWFSWWKCRLHIIDYKCDTNKNHFAVISVRLIKSPDEFQRRIFTWFSFFLLLVLLSPTWKWPQPFSLTHCWKYQIFKDLIGQCI